MSNDDDRFCPVVCRTRQSAAYYDLKLEDRLSMKHYTFVYVEPIVVQRGLWDQDLGTSLRDQIWRRMGVDVVEDGSYDEKTKKESGE